MQVELIQYDSPYCNPHHLAKPASGDFIFEVSGQVSMPSGHINVTTYTGNNYVPYKSWSPAGYSWMIFRVHIDLNTTYAVYAKIDRIDHYDGTHAMIYYTVSWLTTYYNLFLRQNPAPTDYLLPFKPINGCDAYKSNLWDYWDRWKFCELPTTGKKSFSTYTGLALDRMDDYSVFMIVLKCPNNAAGALQSHSPKSVYLAYYLDIKQMLTAYAAGDDPDITSATYQLPSVLLDVIEGIYYLPGVTYTVDSGSMPATVTTNLSGVNAVSTFCAINHTRGDGTIEQLDLINAHPRLFTNIVQIDYNANLAATLPITTNLDINLFDFRDLYYKKYQIHIPYIGQVDVPITRLATYPNAANVPDNIELNITYHFDIYSGTLTFRWDGFSTIDACAPVSLPTVPLILSGAGVGMYQTDAKSELSRLGAGMSALATFISQPLGAAGSLGNYLYNIYNIGAQETIAQNINATAGFTAIASSGWSGYAHTYFTLIVEELEIALTSFTDYMQGHGIPLLDMDAAITDSGYIWINADDFRLDYNNVSQALYIAGHEREIQEELNILKYISIGNPAP